MRKKGVKYFHDLVTELYWHSCNKLATTWVVTINDIIFFSTFSLLSSLFFKEGVIGSKAVFFKTVALNWRITHRFCFLVYFTWLYSKRGHIYHYKLWFFFLRHQAIFAYLFMIFSFSLFCSKWMCQSKDFNTQIWLKINPPLAEIFAQQYKIGGFLKFEFREGKIKGFFSENLILGLQK